MSQSKRRNYLIDKPFQIGFILKYLVVILLTVFLCFGVTAIYFYYDNLFGENRVNETVIVKYRRPLKAVEKIDKDTNMKTMVIAEKGGYSMFNSDELGVTLYRDENNVYKVFDFNLAGRQTPNIMRNEAYAPNQVVSLSPAQEQALVTPWGPFEKTTQRFFIVIYPLVWTCLAILLMISIYSLFFSHRMAGPVYRMRVSLDRMLAGDLDFKIRVRRSDFFRNIVEKLEQLRIKTKGDGVNKSE